MTARRPLRRLHLFTLLALVALTLGVTPAIVHATTITVTTTADEYGTGSGCSLREAIHAANQDTAFGGCVAGSGADTISVPGGTYTLTRAGADEDAAATGDLDITTSLTITGAGRSTTVIESNAFDRVFDIHGADVAATIAQVAARGSGTRYTQGGGIRNSGRASVLRSTVTGSTGKGGGIANDGEMTVVESLVSGEAMGGGGGVLNTGLLMLRNSTVRDGNVPSSGGGILNSGTATLTNSTISNNHGGEGGGIYNSGTVTLTNSTISHNGASEVGGIHNSGTMTVTNSTISNNGAPEGAGIWNSGTLRTSNSTISANAARSVDEDDSEGGGIVNSGGTVTLAHTILAANSAEDLATADCRGTITSAGYNLFGVTTGCTITGETTGNQTGVNPWLGPLEDNGGPSWTHAPLAGSPAIDAGNPAQVGGGAACEATDQRGVARPADGDGNGSQRCDIGAYEREPVTTVRPTRTSSPTRTRTPTPTRTATSSPTATPTATLIIEPPE